MQLLRISFDGVVGPPWGGSAHLGLTDVQCPHLLGLWSAHAPWINPTTVSLAAVIVSVLALLATTLINVRTAQGNSKRASTQMLFSTRVAAYQRYLAALDEMSSVVMTAVYAFSLGDNLDSETEDAKVSKQWQQAMSAVREIRLLDGENLGREAESQLHFFYGSCTAAYRTNYHDGCNVDGAKETAFIEMYPKFTKALIGVRPPFYRRFLLHSS